MENVGRGWPKQLGKGETGRNKRKIENNLFGGFHFVGRHSILAFNS
jgi:hypothetical protein